VGTDRLIEATGKDSLPVRILGISIPTVAFFACVGGCWITSDAGRSVVKYSLTTGAHATIKESLAVQSAPDHVEPAPCRTVRHLAALPCRVKGVVRRYHMRLLCRSHPAGHRNVANPDSYRPCSSSTGSAFQSAAQTAQALPRPSRTTRGSWRSRRRIAGRRCPGWGRIQSRMRATIRQPVLQRGHPIAGCWSIARALQRRASSSNSSIPDGTFPRSSIRRNAAYTSVLAPAFLSVSSSLNHAYTMTFTGRDANRKNSR